MDESLTSVTNQIIASADLEARPKIATQLFHVRGWTSHTAAKEKHTAGWV